jgi:hypothetical protein
VAPRPLVILAVLAFLVVMTNRELRSEDTPASCRTRDAHAPPPCVAATHARAGMPDPSLSFPLDREARPRFASARNAVAAKPQPLGFQPDRYALGGQIGAKPLAGFQQLDDHPVLVPQIRGAGALDDGNARGGGRVLPTEVAQMLEVINFPGGGDAGDARVYDGEPRDFEWVFFPFEFELSLAPDPSDAGSQARPVQ